MTEGPNEATETTSTKEKPERRDIKGGIPYSTSPGVLKKTLELIINAERPEKFNQNFLETVLKQSGGGARQVGPFLKKMNFIGADGTPSTLYSKFKTDSGRSVAAYEGLKNAFSELFRRNEFIHKADESGVKDLIVEITGLKKTDPVLRLMYSSFDAIRGFIKSDLAATEKPLVQEPSSKNVPDHNSQSVGLGKIGLSYQINIVLPESENISVFNAIFKSLRENLLK